MNNRFDTELKYIKPKDLFFVILYGVVLQILFGFAIGFLDYYISTFIHFSVAILFLFITAQYIGNAVRAQSEYPHIVYIVITGIFLAVQALLALALPTMINIITEYQGLVFSGLSDLFNPTIFFNLFYRVVFAIFFRVNFQSLLIILFVSVAIYTGVKKTY